MIPKSLIIHLKIRVRDIYGSEELKLEEVINVNVKVVIMIIYIHRRVYRYCNLKIKTLDL
ncbi:hypothetical protein Leryth_024201, partial [Lithospermum erythrorhizon]